MQTNRLKPTLLECIGDSQESEVLVNSALHAFAEYVERKAPEEEAYLALPSEMGGNNRDPGEFRIEDFRQITWFGSERGWFRSYRQKGAATSESGVLEYYGESQGQHKFHVIFGCRGGDQILDRAVQLYEQAVATA